MMGFVKKYNGDGEKVVSPGGKTEEPRRDAMALSRSATRSSIPAQIGFWVAKR
jgi:hypothetical protein